MLSFYMHLYLYIVLHFILRQRRHEQIIIIIINSINARIDERDTVVSASARVVYVREQMARA